MEFLFALEEGFDAVESNDGSGVLCFLEEFGAGEFGVGPCHHHEGDGAAEELDGEEADLDEVLCEVTFAAEGIELVEPGDVGGLEEHGFAKEVFFRFEAFEDGPFGDTGLLCDHAGGGGGTVFEKDLACGLEDRFVFDGWFACHALPLAFAVTRLRLLLGAMCTKGDFGPCIGDNGPWRKVKQGALRWHLPKEAEKRQKIRR